MRKEILKKAKPQGKRATEGKRNQRNYKNFPENSQQNGNKYLPSNNLNVS